MLIIHVCEQMKIYDETCVHESYVSLHQAGTNQESKQQVWSSCIKQDHPRQAAIS